MSIQKPILPVKFFVTGIGTDVGKTVVSAILTEWLQADYWKPIQTGSLENSDLLTLKKLVSNSKTIFHPSSYQFDLPASPNIAAAAENKKIDFHQIILPETHNHLIVEGAGGVLVPITSDFLMVDLIVQLNLPIILVVKSYLGCINHCLLTVESLKSRKIKIAGLVFNGEFQLEVKETILHFSKTNELFSIPVLEELSASTLQHFIQNNLRKEDFLSCLV